MRDFGEAGSPTLMPWRLSGTEASADSVEDIPGDMRHGDMLMIRAWRKQAHAKTIVGPRRGDLDYMDVVAYDEEGHDDNDDG